MGFSSLTHVNAALNFLSACLLLLGFLFVRQGRLKAHRNCMISAVTVSGLFLVSYLVYHYNAGRTVFRDPAWFRPYYLALLLSHTLLAVAIVPSVLVLLGLAWRQKFERHKKLARWVWPIWVYVSVTGVLIYLLLYHIFPQQS